MCKQFLVFALMLGLVSSSYGVVIGDWGNGMDGWTAEGGTLSDSTVGGGSLKVQVQGSSWYQPLVDKALTPEQAALVANGTYNTFKLDVTRFAAEGWTTTDAGWGWWTPESRIFLSLSAGAWNDLGVQKFVGAGREILGANWYPSTLNAGDAFIAPGMLPWRNSAQYADPDGMLNAAWDLTAEIANIKAELTDMGYIYDLGMDIRLIANVTCWNGPGPSTYYLDNAQLTPEPATMVLLGLGGLAMIRRKR
jgi:hypothetical protein